MALLNPAIRNPLKGRKMQSELEVMPDATLGSIFCLDKVASDKAIENIAANGVEVVADAIAKGFRWDSIAKHFGCTEAHLRKYWLGKLKSEDKQLIAWAERANSERLAAHLVGKMEEVIERDYCLEGFDQEEQLNAEMKIASIKDKELQGIERVAKFALAHANSGKEEGGSKAVEQIAPQVNIVINSDSAKGMLAFNDKKVIQQD